LSYYNDTCLLHKFTSPLLFSFFLLYLKWWQMFLFSFESQLPTLFFFHMSLKSSCKSCASLSPTTFCLYEQVDKLKVLSESLASSTSKAEKRILDHRYEVNLKYYLCSQNGCALILLKLVDSLLSISLHTKLLHKFCWGGWTSPFSHKLLSSRYSCSSYDDIFGKHSHLGSLKICCLLGAWEVLW
jgi:hypothetical protein